MNRQHIQFKSRTKFYITLGDGDTMVFPMRLPNQVVNMTPDIISTLPRNLLDERDDYCPFPLYAISNGFFIICNVEDYINMKEMCSNRDIARGRWYENHFSRLRTRGALWRV